MRKGANRARARPIVFRSYGSAFGRLQGPGIASIIASGDADRGAVQQVDWAGDRNLFAGWKGFFARGDEPTIMVGDLASVRSTWNASERDSQEILTPWPRMADLSTTSPADLKLFLQDRPHLVDRAPRPWPGLFEKTVGAYSIPAIPEPIERAPALPNTPGPASIRPLPNGVNSPTGKTGTVTAKTQSRATGSTGDLVELVMNANEAEWEGDLGAFLRARVTPAMKSVRIRVSGSGAHRFTPVQVLGGINLEIHAEQRRTPSRFPGSPSPR